MKMGLYDEPIKKIRVSVNYLDYMSLKCRNPDGIKELRKLPGLSYSLNQHGFPESTEINSSPVRAYTGGLLNLNQALAIALRPRSRNELSEEVRNFLVLNKDPRLPQKTEDEATEKETIERRIRERAKPPNNQNNNPESTFDFSELGSKMDMSPAAVAYRDLLGQKRRDTNEFYITRRFLFPLAMFGIQSADPAYTAAILGANDFGVKHRNPEIRSASILILDGIVKSIWLKFQMAKQSETLPFIREDGIENFLSIITFKDLSDDLGSLQTINNVLTQDGYGINDSDSDVQNLAEITVQNSSKAQRVIKGHFEEQGYVD